MTPRAIHILMFCVLLLLIFVSYRSFSDALTPMLNYVSSVNINEILTNKNTSTAEEISNSTHVSTIPVSYDISKYYVQGFNLSNPELCPEQGKDIRLLAFVISAPDNFKPRMAIRETWGHFSSRRDVSIAFLIGETTNIDVEKGIADEIELYSDIILARFHDHYNNLTLKSIAMMEWVSEYCLEAKFVLKVDDDMYINMPKLLTFIDGKAEEKGSFFGRLAKGWTPIRDKNNQYYVPMEQFENTVFPDFLSGPSYLFPAPLAPVIYEESFLHKYVKLEDVFITGIVAESLGLKRLHVDSFHNEHWNLVLRPCLAFNSISIHVKHYGQQYDNWKKIMDGTMHC